MKAKKIFAGVLVLLCSLAYVVFTGLPAAQAEGVAPLPVLSATLAPVPLPALNALPPAPAAPSGMQTGEVIGLALTALGFALVRPLTALARSLRLTCDIDPRVISGLLSLCLVTITGYGHGLYGQGWPGILNAVVAGAAAWLHSWGSNRAGSLAAEGGVKRAALGGANDLGDTSTRGGFVVATSVEAQAPEAVGDTPTP